MGTFFLNELTNTYWVQEVPPNRPHELPPRLLLLETAPPPLPDIPSSPPSIDKTIASLSKPSSVASQTVILSLGKPLVLPVRLEKVWPLMHNILLWLDEQGKTHRRMLWKRLNKVIKVYRIRNGIANTMLCLSRKSGGRPYLGKSDAI